MSNLGAVTRIVSAFHLMRYAFSILLLNYHFALVERPYRVPVPDSAAVLFVVPPCAAILLLCAMSSFATYAFSLLTIAIAMAFHISYEKYTDRADLFSPIDQQTGVQSENTSIIQGSSRISFIGESNTEREQVSPGVSSLS